jgi:hypothetical protein
MVRPHILSYVLLPTLNVEQQVGFPPGRHSIGFSADFGELYDLILIFDQSYPRKASRITRSDLEECWSFLQTIIVGSG